MDGNENSCELITKHVTEKNEDGEIDVEENLDLPLKLKKLFNLENY